MFRNVGEGWEVVMVFTLFLVLRALINEIPHLSPVVGDETAKAR